MKKIIITSLLLITAITGYAKKKWAITTTGESLQALTQVTDNQEPCMYPFGGDNGSALFFVARENKKFLYNVIKEGARERQSFFCCYDTENKRKKS